MNYKITNINTYNKNSRALADKFSKSFQQYKDRILGNFLDHLSGKRVLDLGCGGGDASVYMQDKGFLPVAIDLSAGMIKEAKKKGINAIHMDIENLGFKPKSFDGIWAMASLLHVPKDNLANVLSTLSDLLVPGGILYFAIKKGDCGERYIDLNMLAQKQKARGYSDANAGHSPSHLYGAYSKGYIEGKSYNELQIDKRFFAFWTREEILKLTNDFKILDTGERDVGSNNFIHFLLQVK